MSSNFRVIDPAVKAEALDQVKNKGMPVSQAANKALDGSELGGRKVVVNEARPREDRPRNDYNRSGGGDSFRQR